MQLFDANQAATFCAPTVAPPAGAAQSLRVLHDNLRAARITRLRQGDQHFIAHQASLLNAVERWLLLGIANYRRALEMLVPCSAPWAHVTLYYTSFFSANAILGMFGGWVHPKVVVDVENGVPGNQVLLIRRNLRSPNGYAGTHQVFWDFFYEGAGDILPWAPTGLETALEPVNHERTWMISERNDVNYDTEAAVDCAATLHASFNPRRLRSLQGPLRLQLDKSEGLLRLAIRFATDFGVNPASLSTLGNGDLASVIKRLVRARPPSLLNQSAFAELI